MIRARRTISLTKASFQVQDSSAYHTVNGVPEVSRGLFDPDEAGGLYELHLGDPYDRCAII